jgi:hypothetical protein
MRSWRARYAQRSPANYMKISHSSRYTTFFIILGLLSGCSTSTPPDKTHTGVIAGCILDVTAGPDKMALVNANVIILNSEFGARAGKGGKFIITGLPTGRYDVRGSHPSVRWTSVHGGRVAQDSVTLINLRTVSLAIPEDPIPIDWEQSEKRILPLKQFLSSGGIFDFECNP